MSYKFCILAAGKGTRNRAIKGIHKALLPIENKAAITHILDKIPKSVGIVIAVGYKSEQIKSYLKITQPDRVITFIDIENYDGKGSGPGLSLLCCEEHLQSPFIFTSADTIVEESFALGGVKNNWVGFSDVKMSDAATYCLVDGEKYLDRFYYGSGDRAFIGMAGIYDYKKFWDGLRVKSLIKDEHQVLNGFSDLDNIELKYFTWHDTGNEKAYACIRDRFCNDVVAMKNDEAIFIDNGFVIKYFYDTEIVDQRISRVEHLNGVCPRVDRVNDNMFCYRLVDGDVLSLINDEAVLNRILPFWYDTLGDATFKKNDRFLEDCAKMYHDKTHERCEYFYNSPIDEIEYINGAKVDTIKNMLEKVDWDEIYCKAIPSRFHGDYQPENIIYGSDGEFSLIDWRQSFGDSLKVGDSYYDLGKLYHALLINGKDVNNKMYKVRTKDNSAYLCYYSRSNLMYLMGEFKKFCKAKGYSWDNIEMLGTLQYLGIASLYKDFHNGEYGEFLFLYGKYLLSKRIKEQQGDTRTD